MLGIGIPKAAEPSHDFVVLPVEMLLGIAVTVNALNVAPCAS